MIIALTNCSTKTCSVQKYPLPEHDKLEIIELKKCDKDSNFCLPESSPFRFVDKKKLLINNEVMRNYIKKLKNNPSWQN